MIMTCPFQNHRLGGGIHLLANMETIRTRQLELEIDHYRRALHRIANPIKAMQEQAKREGSSVNGAFAVSVSENGAWYKEQAKEALKHKPQ